jgi:uncharacterized paraquat-inducible protein A
METALASCTECGANIAPNQGLCPRCHRPRWYTLKKLSVLLLIVGLLAALIKLIVEYGVLTLGQWYG